MKILALCLAAALASAPAWGQAREAAPFEAHLDVQSSAAEVGEPIAIELVARQELPAIPAGADALRIEREARRELRQHFGDELFPQGELDYSWELLDANPLVIRRSGEAESGGALIATRRFRLVSLEAGTRALPKPAFEGELATVDIEFTSLLAEGEDQPRPLILFRDVPPETASSERSVWPGAALGAALLALLVGVLVKRRSKKKTAGTVGNPRAALEALMARTRAAGSTDEVLHAAHFHLTALVRTALDGRLKQTQPLWNLRGATDEEWLAARLPLLGFNEEQADRLQQLFEGSGRVKYGGEAVTEWGLQERVDRALELTAEGGQG